MIKWEFFFLTVKWWWSTNFFLEYFNEIKIDQNQNYFTSKQF